MKRIFASLLSISLWSASAFAASSTGTGSTGPSWPGDGGDADIAELFDGQESVYATVFAKAYEPKCDGAIAMKGDVASGLLTGYRANGEGAALVVSSTQTTSQVLAAMGYCQIAMDAALIAAGATVWQSMEVEGVLIGANGAIAVTAFVYPAPAAFGPDYWIVMPFKSGDSVFDVAVPQTSGVTPSGPAIPFGSQVQSATQPGEDCAEVASAKAGPRPDCNPNTDGDGIRECMRAANCRRRQCNWDAKWDHYFCTCENPPVQPPPGVVCPPGGDACAWEYNGAIAACQAVYVAEMLLCVPSCLIPS